MAVIAHEMDLTTGLFEISKRCDYRSLPGECWLESVQSKSMMGSIVWQNFRCDIQSFK